VRDVRCSVLQRVAVCCSVLQRVAACCSVLQCVAASCSVLHVCRSALNHLHSHTYKCFKCIAAHSYCVCSECIVWLARVSSSDGYLRPRGYFRDLRSFLDQFQESKRLEGQPDLKSPKKSKLRYIAGLDILGGRLHIRNLGARRMLLLQRYCYEVPVLLIFENYFMEVRNRYSQWYKPNQKMGSKLMTWGMGSTTRVSTLDHRVSFYINSPIPVERALYSIKRSMYSFKGPQIRRHFPHATNVCCVFVWLWLWLCLCLCLCVCVCEKERAREHAWERAREHECTYTFTYIYTYMYIHMYIYVYIHLYMRTSIVTYIYICTHTIHIYIDIYTNIHTNIRIYISVSGRDLWTERVQGTWRCEKCLVGTCSFLQALSRMVPCAVPDYQRMIVFKSIH